jgi:Kef-type K+ transport system membrane component KefB
MVIGPSLFGWIAPDEAFRLIGELGVLLLALFTTDMTDGSTAACRR